ncbi:MAG: hypothetical protein CL561_02010 [Alphaproteobacteria bacterium]|nr:hypothetical protein [Alphaproteobacteria bacterium]
MMPIKMADPQRILIVGCPGAGKTTFAKRLATETGLPLVHMDALYWSAGWVERPYDEFIDGLNDALMQERWIIDGNYLTTLPLRLARAQKIYFLDEPFWRCTYRVIKRWVKQEGQQAEGCPQKIDWAFLKYVAWDFPLFKRRKLIDALAQFAGDVVVRTGV